MRLQTKRCLIRKMDLNDAKELYPVLSDAEVMQYIEPVFTKEQTAEFIRSAALCEPPLVYAVVWKDTGTVIGHVIFHIYEERSYEIGWILHRNYWGMGIAGELTKELVQYARQMGAESCIIECDPAQSASKRIAEKNGFAYEGLSDGLSRYRMML